ncbi:hypothetical protein LCGC14_0223480 [marine sediment metagenome]|uniref:Uncharacterized protein n=1 Tax=marine sediment metagenome TaxID=412755 RepID=A0A0F9UC83_9ZZZZ|nr:hypothetical protein [bacterium]
MTERVSGYKKYTWATSLNVQENAYLERVIERFFTEEIIEGKSRYSLVKFLTDLCSKVLYDDSLILFINRTLLSKSYIHKKGDMIEGINKMLVYAMNYMPEDSEW